ncbi:putative Streptomycin 3''-kinase [Nitrospira japonica]|uniref:Putative Streptomycin 3''-kinase n=1 Tax=Nitrospira japonica TaxID=1325564 RepID=A0A1W1I9Q5_9BACT|nr:aminoglycoside phosphotransferase family protein [Nitrospira japonica]SLM49777.1 putative Streptomycin 3''-kinase [Nitrospira japonica]
MTRIHDNQPPDISYYCDKWTLSFPIRLAQTPTSALFRVTRLDQQAILKVLTPKGRTLEGNGSSALKCFQGPRAVKLLDSDDGAMLLEHLDGGELSHLVKQGSDAQAAHIICDVLDALHSYAGETPAGIQGLHHEFQSLFTRARGEKPDSIFRRAAKVAETLIATESNRRLLHGDIHHGNILKSSSRGWVAIDPQGLFGERTYDVANSFFNPDEVPHMVGTRERIDLLATIFSERLQVDRLRILQFAYAHGSLSASWHIDDGESPQWRLHMTSLIEKLL